MKRCYRRKFAMSTKMNSGSTFNNRQKREADAVKLPLGWRMRGEREYTMSSVPCISTDAVLELREHPLNLLYLSG